MTIQQKKQPGMAAERILGTASELFYKQGYRATGINEVIKKSGVAKATFYSHFPTKDDLCESYLKGLSESVLTYFENYIANAKGTFNRFISAIQLLEPWLKDTEFRGCGFLNIASEIPDHNNPLRGQGTKLYDEIHKHVVTLCEELIDSDSNKYGHINAIELSKEYMVILVGAIALSEIYHNTAPVKDAVRAISRLIDKKPQ